MKNTTLLTVLVLSWIACSALPPSSRASVHKPPVPADVTFIQQLDAHIARYDIMRPLYASAEAVLKDALESVDAVGGPLVYRGINTEWTGSGVHLFVVDVRGVLADRNVCRPGDPKWALQCFKLEYFRNNCGIFSSNSIVCDFALVWRLVRESSMLAFAAYRRPDAGSYYFPRDALRAQFLGGEAAYGNTAAKVRNIEDIAGVVSRQSKTGLDVRDFDETRERAFAGFMEFLLSHEVGHLRLGHDVGKALPNCALPPDPTDDLRLVLCEEPSPEEVAADRWALDFLRRRIRPDTFGPARASPELFVEEYERRRWLALQDLKIDPVSWNESTAQPRDVERFNQRLLMRIATGSHPSDLRRYAELMALLEDGGVSIESSRSALNAALAEIRLIDTLCRSHDGGYR